MYGVRLVGPDETAGGRNGAHPAPPLVVRDVGKVYTSRAGATHALRGVHLVVGDGQIVAIRGRSGAGKTTLLNIVAGLDDPTSGEVLLFGRNLATLSEAERTRLRRTELGFVFQSAHLVPAFTARENVEVPLRLASTAPAERTQRAREALALVGLAAREQHRAPELSGGEQQRVALARALVHAPHLVLADEPTGNLDSHTGLQVLELLRSVADAAGISFLIATHDAAVSQVADAVYDLHDGVLTHGSR